MGSGPINVEAGHCSTLGADHAAGAMLMWAMGRVPLRRMNWTPEGASLRSRHRVGGRDWWLRRMTAGAESVRLQAFVPR